MNLVYRCPQQRRHRWPKGNGSATAEIETIRLAYAETGSQREAARRAKCAVSAVKRYITPVQDGLEQLRTAKKVDIIEEIAAVRLVLLRAMTHPDKIAKASVTELATSFGILTDKHQLVSGKATSRSEQRNPLAVWSDDEIDALAAMAERRGAGQLVS